MVPSEIGLGKTLRHMLAGRDSDTVGRSGFRVSNFPSRCCTPRANHGYDKLPRCQFSLACRIRRVEGKQTRNPLCMYPAGWRRLRSPVSRKDPLFAALKITTSCLSASAVVEEKTQSVIKDINPCRPHGQLVCARNSTMSICFPPLESAAQTTDSCALLCRGVSKPLFG
ncbi:hypothetical protein ZHAS_00005795 [Anopheles sinensis]|uniref:Uncharacterized protein n=1 Tax=Anopheles sinensis TaxID=74873 RepID=A0A084VKD8_ANOSI|nr:hypothetical protein ZHAS_00005795 [Anopheles sinensis]